MTATMPELPEPELPEPELPEPELPEPELVVWPCGGGVRVELERDGGKYHPVIRYRGDLGTIYGAQLKNVRRALEAADHYLERLTPALSRADLSSA